MHDTNNKHNKNTSSKQSTVAVEANGNTRLPGLIAKAIAIPTRQGMLLVMIM